MSITKDLNMDGVCECLDPQMLDIWIADAPMKNNAKDTMKAKLFLCGLKITTYDFNIYISYCSFSNTKYFLYDVGFPLRLL
jgi:hypothetical protein